MNIRVVDNLRNLTKTRLTTAAEDLTFLVTPPEICDKKLEQGRYAANRSGPLGMDKFLSIRPVRGWPVNKLVHREVFLLLTLERPGSVST